MTRLKRIFRSNWNVFIVATETWHLPRFERHDPKGASSVIIFSELLIGSHISTHLFLLFPLLLLLLFFGCQHLFSFIIDHGSGSQTLFDWRPIFFAKLLRGPLIHCSSKKLFEWKLFNYSLKYKIKTGTLLIKKKTRIDINLLLIMTKNE